MKKISKSERSKTKFNRKKNSQSFSFSWLQEIDKGKLLAAISKLLITYLYDSEQTQTEVNEA